MTAANVGHKGAALQLLDNPVNLWRRFLARARAREARLDAERPASRATRWRRLLAAVADSVLAKFGWGRTLELGRSLRTRMMLRPPVVCDSTPVQQLR